MNKNFEGRINWVDYAKAIGIFLVVYGHVARGIKNSGIKIPTGLYEMTDSVIYSFHMPLFFFLSGLFFLKSFEKLGAKYFLFNKIDTIIYPYILWSLLQGGIESILSNYTNGTASAGNVLSLIWQPRAQFWFLYVLFFILVICSAAYSTRRKETSLAILPLAILLNIFPQDFSHFWVLNLISSNLVYFVLGIIFTSHMKTEYFSGKIILAATILIFALSQWIFHVGLSLKYTDRGILSLILAVISILFVISLSVNLSKKSIPLLKILGSASMAVYLMHIIAGSGTRILLKRFFLVEAPFLHLTFGCFFAIAIPLLAVKIFEKYQIRYLFSAPICFWITEKYKNTRQMLS